jgi:hypothetical protein
VNYQASGLAPWPVLGAHCMATSVLRRSRRKRSTWRRTRPGSTSRGPCPWTTSGFVDRSLDGRSLGLSGPADA